MEAEVTYTQAEIGLSARRPFRLCSLHFGASKPELVQPGYNPGAGELQCVEAHWEACPERSATPWHAHEFYEIALIQDGEVFHEWEGGQEVLRRGGVVLATPGGLHRYASMEYLVKTNLYLQPDWMFEELRLLWHETGLVRHLLADALFARRTRPGVFVLNTTEEETARWEREIDTMQREVRKQAPSYVLLNGAFLKILGILNGAFLRQNFDAALPIRPEVWDAAEGIEDLIQKSQRCRIEALAAKVDLPPERFSRMFEANTGMPPSEYYQRRRIQHAARLLTEPSASITSIARDLGFADLAHFSRMFKRFTGQPPKAYRKEHMPV